jgi:hypothetical protein
VALTQLDSRKVCIFNESKPFAMTNIDKLANFSGLMSKGTTHHPYTTSSHLGRSTWVSPTSRLVALEIFYVKLRAAQLKVESIPVGLRIIWCRFAIHFRLWSKV